MSSHQVFTKNPPFQQAFLFSREGFVALREGDGRLGKTEVGRLGITGLERGERKHTWNSGGNIKRNNMQMSNKLITIIIVLVVSAIPLYYLWKGKISVETPSIHWIEAQVLCVYWAVNIGNRDTLPSINIILSLNDGKVYKLNSFSFYFNGNAVPLKKAAIKSSNNELKAGLAIESKELYPYFPNEFPKEGNSCYEDELLKLVENGNLVMHDVHGIELPIEKSNAFIIYKGLK